MLVVFIFLHMRNKIKQNFIQDIEGQCMIYMSLETIRFSDYSRGYAIQMLASDRFKEKSKN